MKERKSKSITVFTMPTLLEEMKKIAHMKDWSLNQTLNIAFREYVKSNQILIEEYNKLEIEENLS